MDWLTLPPLRPPNWWLPRGPRAAACAGLKVYQPMTSRGRAAWLTTRLAARLGGLGLLAHGQPPPDAVVELAAPHLPAGGAMAVMRREGGHRFVVLIMSPAGRPLRVAKVALSDTEGQALRREAEAIATYGRWLAPPLAAPCVLASESRLLLLDAVDWQVQARPWRLTSSVAAALGAFHRRGRSGHAGGLAHGDCTPWNLLRHAHGWVLVDWGHAGPDVPAYFDILHFFVQSSRNLGRPSQRAIVRGVTSGAGWIGRAVQAYADAAGLDRDQAVGYLRTYLWAREARIDLRTPQGRSLLLTTGSHQAQALGRREGP